MSDWQDATDPVPRRELTEAQRAAQRARGLQRIGRMKKAKTLRVPLSADSVPTYVDPDFDEMGA